MHFTSAPRYLLSLYLLLFTSIIAAQKSKPFPGYGKWETDQFGFPCFVTDLEKHSAPWYPFSHLMGTGQVMVLTNQWGAVNLFFAGNSGMINISPSTYKSRSGFYLMLQTGKALYSLIYSELDTNKKITYGIGYTTYQGELKRDGIHLRIKYSIRTPFDFSKGFYSDVEVENLSALPLKGKLKARADIWPKKDFPDFDQWLGMDKNLQNENGKTAYRHIQYYGDIYLIGNKSWSATSKEHTLELSKNIMLPYRSEEQGFFFLGVDSLSEAGYEKIQSFSEADIIAKQKTWNQALAPVHFQLPEKWMEEECLWSYAQLLSYCFYDPSVQEYIVNLGGYGLGMDASVPNLGFSMREISETAMILTYFNPSLARSSLRWLSKLQLISGDLPRTHLYTKIKKMDPGEIFNGKYPNESDTEIWYLLAIAEYIHTTHDYHFLDEELDYMTIDKKGSIWEHAKAAFAFIKNYIGTGSHGLVRMLNGDWNDYLSKIGSGNNGESMMNTGMLCRALIDLKPIAEQRGDKGFSEEIIWLYDSLQAASGRAFDRSWFVRGYDDHGHAIGGYGDRLFLNAQSWTCLGKAGTDGQRKTALENMLSACNSKIGLTLMSKPYSSPAPDISWAPIESGEGENAGIWPQTVHWSIWALAEAGFYQEALSEWKKISLRNHSRLYPEVPFGIFNGPDCYSSYFAGKREGWTQTGTFNRMLEIPMNPMIAWQVFSMKKIMENKK